VILPDRAARNARMADAYGNEKAHGSSLGA